MILFIKPSKSLTQIQTLSFVSLMEISDGPPSVSFSHRSPHPRLIANYKQPIQPILASRRKPVRSIISSRVRTGVSSESRAEVSLTVALPTVEISDMPSPQNASNQVPLRVVGVLLAIIFKKKSSPDMSVQSYCSHVPLCSVQTLSTSIPLQQQSDSVLPSQLKVSPIDQPLTAKMHPESQTTASPENGKHFPVTSDEAFAQLPSELGLDNSNGANTAPTTPQSTVACLSVVTAVTNIVCPVEVGMPNDEFDGSSSIEESNFVAAETSMGAMEEQVPFSNTRNDGQTLQQDGHSQLSTNKCSVVPQEINRNKPDMVIQPETASETPATLEAADNLESSETLSPFPLYEMNNSTRSEWDDDERGTDHFLTDKDIYSSSERYVEDPFMPYFDEYYPFPRDFIGLFKKKKGVLKETDYCDTARESFEAELERVVKMQEMERRRLIEEQEKAMELAHREEVERLRLVREEEEKQRRSEEEAGEAAWRIEQEQFEAFPKAEELRIGKEEEKRRLEGFGANDTPLLVGPANFNSQYRGRGGT